MVDLSPRTAILMGEIQGNCDLHPCHWIYPPCLDERQGHHWLTSIQTLDMLVHMFTYGCSIVSTPNSPNFSLGGELAIIVQPDD
jgi:hypothetical protein